MMVYYKLFCTESKIHDMIISSFLRDYFHVVWKFRWN